MSNILRPDINVEYNIPFAPTDKVYIRTGVHGDGSCFYHSYLRIIHPSYRYATYNERCKLVTQLREQLAEQVTNESLMELGNGEPRRLMFFQLLNARLSAGFPDTDEYGHILNQLISLTPILEATTTFKGNFYITFVEKIKEQLYTKIGNKGSKFDKYIDSWSYELFYTINEQIIENFKHKLLTDQVSAFEIEYISRCLHYNFLFLRDNRNVCEYYPTGVMLNEEWPVIILLWRDDCHYEIIGEMRHDRTVKRKFNVKDNTVQCIVNTV